MKLSKRLSLIASMIPCKSRVIDIGCDHGFLDIFLVKEKQCCCTAADINETCLNKAKNNIKEAGLEQEIVTICTNGLEGISVCESDYVVIAGMGTKTILSILEARPNCHLIIQANTELEVLRKFLFSLYLVLEEHVLLDKGITYVIVHLIPGKGKYHFSDYFIGPFLKKNPDYVRFLLEQQSNIYAKIPRKYIRKRLSLLKRIKILKHYLKYMS